MSPRSLTKIPLKELLGSAVAFVSESRFFRFVSGAKRVFFTPLDEGLLQSISSIDDPTFRLVTLADGGSERRGVQMAHRLRAGVSFFCAAPASLILYHSLAKSTDSKMANLPGIRFADYEIRPTERNYTQQRRNALLAIPPLARHLPGCLSTTCCILHRCSLRVHLRSLTFSCIGLLPMQFAVGQLAGMPTYDYHAPAVICPALMTAQNAPIEAHRMEARTSPYATHNAAMESGDACGTDSATVQPGFLSQDARGIKASPHFALATR